MRWNPTIVVFALIALCAAPIQADDEVEEKTITRFVDLRGYELPAAPKGPRISVPTDIMGTELDPGNWQVWSIADWATNGTWLPFDEPVLERSALHPDTVCAVLQSTVAAEEHADALEIEEQEGRLVLRGPTSIVEEALRRAPWALAGLAPSVRVDAALTSAAGGEEQRLRALGGASLWPGRWTRVYLQQSRVPCTVEWDIEIAEEATTMAPRIAGVAQGQELYLRYHPGETGSLVEVWAGSVEHLEILRQDLSAIRNVPEANGPGVLTFPRSAANRSYAQVILRPGQTKHELRWTNEGRETRLQLAFGDLPPRSAAVERADGNAVAFLRAGALSAQLEFEARTESVEAWTERIASNLYKLAEQREKNGQETNFSTTAVDGGEILFLDAPAAEMSKARDVIRVGEADLRGSVVDVRVLAVPEAAYRKAHVEGAVRVGAAVSSETVAAFLEAGAADQEAAHLPALLGTRAAFRVGHTVPGLVEVEAEVAQRAAGLHPIASVRFAGLAGDVLVRQMGEARYVAHVRGTLSWARSDAGVLELSIRPPVAMAGPRGGNAETRPGADLVSLPMLGGGAAPIDTQLTFAGNDARQHLAHVHVRGDEVILLLVRVRSASAVR